MLPTATIPPVGTSALMSRLILPRVVEIVPLLNATFPSTVKLRSSGLRRLA